MTREEAGSSSNTVIIFVICLIFVYVILCALYESLFIPLAVMLSVPFGLFGSFLFAKVFGLENNIYMQVGLIMLIGLLAKTAILLTEYALERRREGMTIASAAMSAAGARLRPIIMTALAMLIGMLPLALSSGAGANGNVSLSMGVIGGLSVGIELCCSSCRYSSSLSRQYRKRLCRTETLTRQRRNRNEQDND